MLHLIQKSFPAWRNIYILCELNPFTIHLLWNRSKKGKNVKGKIKYTTVHIPTVLAQLIDEIIENGELAYASRSEFIKDAIRRFLEYYGSYPRKNETQEKSSAR